MSKKLYLGLIGEAGSGKDTVAEVLEEKYGARVLTSSYLLKKALGVFLDSIGRADYIWFVKELTSKYGEDIISKAMLKAMRSFTDDIVVFNGVRLPSDYEYLKKERSFLVYVTADPQVRWQRVSRRHEKADDDIPFDKFMEMHQTKTEIDVPELGKKADYTITNNGTLEELHAQIDEVMKSIKEQV